MFPAWILLTLNSLFFTLRLSGGVTGSFPRPLKAEEERNFYDLTVNTDTQILKAVETANALLNRTSSSSSEASSESASEPESSSESASVPESPSTSASETQ